MIPNKKDPELYDQNHYKQILIYFLLLKAASSSFFKFKSDLKLQLKHICLGHILIPMFEYSTFNIIIIKLFFIYFKLNFANPPLNQFFY